jgi:hypothetical protein
MRALVAVIIAIALIANGILIKQWSDCNQAGGAFVKTLFWYSCIEKGRH